MTKRLRFLFVTLLAIVCAVGGYAETKSVVCTLAKDAKSSTVKGGDISVSWNYSLAAKSLDSGKGVQFLTTNTKPCDLTATFSQNINITSVVINAAKSGPKNKTIEVKVNNTSLGKQTISSTTSSDFTFSTKESIKTNSLVINLAGTATDKSHYVKTVTITYDDAVVTPTDPALTSTSVSFGANVDEQTFSLEEGKLNGADFSLYTTATETTGVEGSVAYSVEILSGNAVVTVGTDGALTLHPDVYGKVKITATFTPTDAEKYAKSTAWYTVENNKKIDESTIVFDCSTYSKDIVGSEYNANTNTKRELPSVAGKSYEFTLTDANFISQSVQLKASSGKMVSPVFTSFPNGYKVVVTYAQNVPLLSSTELSNATSVTDAAKKTISIELPSPNATFTVKAGSAYTQIKKMELTPLAPAKPSPELSFAQSTVNVELNQNDGIIGVQNITKPAGFDGNITYVSSNNEVAEVSDGNILMYKVGSVTITATSEATETYSAGTASYKLVISDSRKDGAISFSAATKDLSLTSTGVEFDCSTLLVKANDADATKKITYSMTPTSEDAEIDANSGRVVFGGSAEGEYVVTASFPGDNNYKPCEATLKLVVKDSRAEDSDFKFSQESYQFDLAEAGAGTVLFDVTKDGELNNPHSLNVTLSISPNDKTTAVDGKSVLLSKRGTYTLTAVGAGNETYKTTTATCTIVVINSAIRENTVEFVAGTDKGTNTNTNSIKDDSMSKDGVNIVSGRALLGIDSEYRFYKTANGQKGETTFSTETGYITKIEFVAEGSDCKPDNFTANVGSYDKTNYVWTATKNVKSVTFTASSKVAVTKIKVTVKQPKDFEFDETSETITLEDCDIANVKVNRVISADNSWWTLCLPFGLDAEQIAHYFGADTKLCTFGSMNGTVMNFSNVETMEAGVPYLIKPTQNFDGNNTTFEGVQLKAADPQPKGDETGYAMVGTYGKKTDLATDGTALFLATNNTFKKPSATNHSMKGFRVYFSVPKDKNGVPMPLTAANIDGVETSIISIDGAQLNSDARVYNLQGQCLGTSLDKLPSGVYVQGGKKIVVK